MKDTDRLLSELPPVLPPTIPLVRVSAWVKQGRARKRFYPVVWLSRVWRWHSN
ncbi:hypothetical protein [Lewinella sp. IMCC34191]|uniref:hypothetical protein n=1 Tax=Lewinella sp. IMCC34191 TaxID=2259172 RepID=UPI00130064CB|nr:hypothetical protein [Lewinella sp. IMCC34191]